MFKERFAKYARAVSDERERALLYKKYNLTAAFVTIYLALCLALLAAVILIFTVGAFWTLVVGGVLLILWLACGIAALCLLISFSAAYNALIRRPAQSGEMPEVTAYRQKAVQQKKSTFKRLWWAWLVFIVCVAAFIACIAVDVVQNPDSDDLGLWGNIAIWVLLAGALTLSLAYVFNAYIQQQRGKSFEQQTAQEAAAIDRAQGRAAQYDMAADPNIREEKSYEYLFPNAMLRAEANRERARRSKVITACMIAFIIVGVSAFVILLSSEELFGRNITGYAVPVFFTVVFVGTYAVSFATGGRLRAVEERQRAELEAVPGYAKNLEWYRLYNNFSKFKGKIFIIFVAISIVLAWVLGALLPDTGWSFLAVVPLIVGGLINGRLVKDLRKKALPIENEIDRQNAMRERVADTGMGENTVGEFNGDIGGEVK